MVHHFEVVIVLNEGPLAQVAGGRCLELRFFFDTELRSVLGLKLSLEIISNVIDILPQRSDKVIKNVLADVQ